MNEEEKDKLSFYIVNFLITTCTALFLFGILSKLGFQWQLSILGTIFFLTSRITVISVATPLVDSLYFLAIGAIIYLMLYEKTVLLACILPLLVIVKETMVPFLFIPFAVRNMRRWKMVSSVSLSIVIFFVLRGIIQQKAAGTQPIPIPTAIYHAWLTALPSLKRLFSPVGIHDLFNGFAFLLVLAPLGLLVNWKYHKYKIPGFLLLFIPIAFVLALLNGSLGRMFFITYVPVIAYSLVLIEQWLSNNA